MRLFGKFSAMLMAFFVAGCFSSLVAMAQTTDQITMGNCKHCAKVCTDTLKYCTNKKGRYGQASVTDALKDAISACKAAEDFIARGSRLQSKYAAICVEACNTAVKTCESFKADTTMNACANELRKTSGNCTRVASAK